MSAATWPKRRRDLWTYFKCPNCFRYILPPIYQCAVKHLVCTSCMPNLDRCSISKCRLGPFGINRNIALEEAANSICFPCKYSANGCIFSILPSNKVDHEAACKFRPYKCPHPSGVICPWENSLELVVSHLLENHESIIFVSGEDINVLAESINSAGDFAWVTIQSCLGHHFMMVLQKHRIRNDHQFFAIVKLIGTCKEAEKFDYRFQLKGQGCCLTWDAVPISIREGGGDTTIVNLDCLKFQSHTAQLFAENGNLSINVIIRKRDPK